MFFGNYPVYSQCLVKWLLHREKYQQVCGSAFKQRKAARYTFDILKWCYLERS